MKRRIIKTGVLIMLTLMFSCDEPETVVTNIVHPDGSVTRKIEMKNIVNKFDLSVLQVPFDSTWIVKDSLEFTEDGDTIWVKRAEKLFKNTDEINMTYQADSGYNKDVTRSTEFRKKFKWFNTEYRFAEIIDKTMSGGYPLSDFLTQEELQWFYSPENINDEKENGPDSLKYRTFSDTVDTRVEKCLIKNVASEWVLEFNRLTGGRAGNKLTMESLNEKGFIKFVESWYEVNKFDSVWSTGFMFKDFYGKSDLLKYKAEADSAAALAGERVFVDFNDYTVRIAMPGKLIGTNGFMDSTRISFWPVKSEYFLTQPYEMWAESKTTNIWVWVVSAIFLVFVLGGIIFRAIKKG
ncbi:MAG: hypothetical protein IQL11_12000 [Bacteroidales bacterium]|nr:hypothetical protein [Bacteroidales bacterium]